MYRILGRDPVTSPLTSLEREVFYRATLEHVEEEFKVRGGEAEIAGRVNTE